MGDMAFRIYNSLSGKKEVFAPQNPPQVMLYCCGPTVYDLLHIGNFRGAVFFNFLRQWLEHRGYQPVFAYNFTDIDDKIVNRAQKENKTTKEIAEKYILEFKKDFNALKLKKHDHNPRATQFLPQMIELIQALLKNKKAYVVDNDVFYSVESFSDYGKLSRRNVKEEDQQSRLEEDKRKKNPKDFALWKSCPLEEPGWPSPWGRGRPGWHIECTTMIFSLLGNNIDIHGGGTDLLFPHHENELAQAEGAKKGPFVKYWVHNNMFTFKGEKMAKSTGNVHIMRSFLQEYNGEVFKYLVLSSHYRSMTEVSENKILQCIQALLRIYTFLQTADSLINSLAKTSVQKIKEAEEKKKESALIEESLDDDLNTPSVLSVIFTLIRQFNEKNNNLQESSATEESQIELAKEAHKIKTLILKYGKMMSLFQEKPSDFLTNIEDIFLKKYNLNREEINHLVQQREQARKNKDFKRADEIRDKLMEMNIEVKDSSSGHTTWGLRP